MKNETKNGLVFWGTIITSATVPGSIAALLGAPWWGITLSAIFFPLIIIGFFIFLANALVSIF